jgi:MFS transporter, PHS family, inorganic phosphate transporter
MPETPRYKVNVKGASLEEGQTAFPGDIEIEDESKEVEKPVSGGFADFKRHFGQWKYGKVLLGTAYCWFAL